MTHEERWSIRRMQLVAAALVALVTLGFALVALVRRDQRIAASPAVPVNLETVQLSPQSTACKHPVYLPAGSGGLRFFAVPHAKPAPPVHVSRSIGGEVVTQVVPGGYGAGFLRVSMPEVDRFESAKVCIANNGKSPLGLGGVVHDSAVASPLRVDGKPIAGDIALDPLFPRRSLLAEASTITRRATVWAPSWIGRWTYYVIFPAGVLMVVAAVWLVLVGRREPLPPSRNGAASDRGVSAPARSLLAIALLALANGLMWASLSPPWQTPDEMHHFEYVQYFAETGRPAGDTKNALPYSSELALAMTRAGTDSVLRNPAGKPPWSNTARTRWRAAQNTTNPSREDGSGTSSASQYTPFYYALAAVGYRAAHNGDVFDRLYASRIVSALLGALAVIFVWLFASEAFGRGGWAPNAAALAVALLPEFGFMAGAVNNDILIVFFASAELYLLARAVRRGLTLRSSALIGAVLALGFLAKPSMAAFAPVVACVLIWPFLRERGLALLRYPATGLLVSLAVWIAWAGIAAAYGRGLVPADTASVRPFVPGDFASYVWHFYLPSLPGMTDRWFGSGYPLYHNWMRTFFASFGWTDTNFPQFVYTAISVTTLLGGAVLAWAGWRYRRSYRIWLPLVSMSALAVVSVLLLVHLIFYRIGGSGEQGRYLLPLAAVFGASVVASAFGLGSRLAPVLTAAYVSAFGCLTVLSYGLVLVRYYT